VQSGIPRYDNNTGQYHPNQQHDVCYGAERAATIASSKMSNTFAIPAGTSSCTAFTVTSISNVRSSVFEFLLVFWLLYEDENDAVFHHHHQRVAYVLAY
jgi:hypothetical protein